MPHCQVCGQRLSFRAYVVGCLTRKTRTFPFHMAVGGRRKEFPTRWQCGGCMKWAEQIRATETVLPTSATLSTADAAPQPSQSPQPATHRKTVAEATPVVEEYKGGDESSSGRVRNFNDARSSEAPTVRHEAFAGKR